MNKITSHTENQPLRAKPRPPPPLQPLLQLSSPHPVSKLPVYPPASGNDHSLDFSLLHTIKNVYGQTKVMTSTPNSSFLPMENYHDRTAHNTIGQRKSKRRSKRTPLPLLVSFHYFSPRNNQ